MLKNLSVHVNTHLFHDDQTFLGLSTSRGALVCFEFVEEARFTEGHVLLVEGGAPFVHATFVDSTF